MITISLLDNSKWVMGRVGMEYRDLIPGGLGGRLGASHIRLNAVGEVPDYVHYHKVRFHVIYCRRGRVKVVYEDCGEPFWLEPGDCVLQPPEIRHRVLEAEAGSEVVEIASPAVHETRADHGLTLPTEHFRPDRDFGGQRFVRHKAADSVPIVSGFGSFETHDTGIEAASGRAASVYRLNGGVDGSVFEQNAGEERDTFYFVLTGRMNAAFDQFGEHEFTPGDSILVPPRVGYRLDTPADAQILCVQISPEIAGI